MMDIITHNPFRVLGVFANASKKEILSSKGKIAAFAKVGKAVECPSDFVTLLDSVDRTETSIRKAESQITLSEDRLKASLFWFWSLTPVDKIAFYHLRGGDINKAVDIWRKVNNISSLQNSIVSFLMQGKVELAISVANLLYTYHTDDLVKMIDDNSVGLSTLSLMQLFVHTLYEQNSDKLKEAYHNIQSQDWKECIKAELSQPLLENINKDITLCHRTRGKGPQIRLDAGNKLMSSAKSFLKEYRQFMTGNDATDFTLLTDKLSEEILMAAIDYYNKTQDYDAPRQALPLMEYAGSVAQGSMQKDRCKKNIATVKEAYGSLPPSSIANDLSKLTDILNRFYKDLDNLVVTTKNYFDPFYDFHNHIQRSPNDSKFIISDRSFHFDGDNGSKRSFCALKMLIEIRPYIASIRSKVGRSEKHYVDVSTQIINNALNAIIDNINEYWVEDKIKLIQNASYKDRALKIFREIFKNSWTAILYMSLLDMSQECRENRYAKNRESLRQILVDIGAFKSLNGAATGSPFTGLLGGVQVCRLYYYPEDEFYSSCNSISEYEEYLRLFPLGKYEEQARAEITKKRAQFSYSFHRKNSTEAYKNTFHTGYSSQGNKGATKSDKSETSNKSDKTSDNDIKNALIVAGIFAFIIVVVIVLIISLSGNNTITGTATSNVLDNTEVADTVYDDYPYEDNTSEDYTETHYNDGDAPFGKGVYQKGSLSTFSISNPTSDDAVVVLINRKGKWVRNAFVSANSSYKMKRIPEGEYIIKVMQGHSWNADKDNGNGNPRGGFMQDVSYCQSSWDDPFDFTYQYTEKYIAYPTGGVTLESINGNMQKENITSNEFFN